MNSNSFIISNQPGLEGRSGAAMDWQPIQGVFLQPRPMTDGLRWKTSFDLQRSTMIDLIRKCHLFPDESLQAGRLLASLVCRPAAALRFRLQDGSFFEEPTGLQFNTGSNGSRFTVHIGWTLSDQAADTRRKTWCQRTARTLPINT